MDNKLVKLRGRRIFPQRTSFQRVSSAPPPAKEKATQAFRAVKRHRLKSPSFLLPKLQGVLPSFPATACKTAKIISAQEWIEALVQEGMSRYPLN